MKFLLPLLILITAISSSPAQDKPASAADLAAQLSAGVLDNSSTARLKMDIIPTPGGEKTVRQLKVNARRTKAASEVHYQVLWPKERKTDSFVLRKPAGQSARGELFQTPDAVKPITNAQLQDGIFGSDLAYEDLVDNFFAWPHQEIIGEETLNRVPCTILLSKPGPGDHSGYTSVKSWIDTKRMVPLQIEKYGPAGQLIRRITITLMAKDDLNRLVPANFSVERPGQRSRTVLEGSNLKHSVTLTDADFSPEVLRATTAKPE